MATSDDIEAPDTLLGQLQRGLGRGYLAAIRAKRGSEELLTCIAHDPRWDRQLEERAAYYGRLAVELRVPVEPIAAALGRGERDGLRSLPADVLAEMAVRGRDDALAALRHGLHQAAWLLALEALSDAEDEYDEVLLRPEDLAAVAGHDREDLRQAFTATGGLPWRGWAAEEPGLRRALEDSCLALESAPRAAAPPPNRAMSTSELLSIADPRNRVNVIHLLSKRRDATSIAALVRAARSDEPNEYLTAYRALGAQGNTELLEHVSTHLEADPGGRSQTALRGAMLRYLESLPAGLTLPRARRWLGQRGGAAVAAQHILERNARPDDRDLVERVLGAALDQGAIYRACSMVEALGTIGDPRSAPLLVSVFERSPYAWARPRVLQALAASGSEQAAPLAQEALWDCDEEARELGARWSALDESSRDRLAEMLRDRFERENVRTAARTRLR